MGDKFTITVNTGELSAAETLLGDLGRNVEEEGSKLNALPGKAASWTGGTAKTLKTEMTRIAGQMAKGAPHFTTAKTAVSTFRGKLEDAQTTTLPDLNRRWNETITTYDSAVAGANRTLSEDMRPYRNMPPEDTPPGLRQARDRAVSGAATARDDAQRKLQGEYDQLITDLKAAATACGTALNGAVLAAVPAEIISSYLGGGGMGPGNLNRDFDKATASTRQALTGDESLAGRADDYRAGQEMAADLKGNLAPGEKMTPEQIAALKANSGNAAYVEGLLGDLGPSGTAALAAKTRQMYGSHRDDERAQGKELFGAMTEIMATGSHIKVADGNGTRYLMDEGWLKNYNPAAYWGDDVVPPQPWVDGYRPDLLIPFMGKDNGYSTNFVGIVAEQALDDYEAFKDVKNLGNDDIYKRYQLYKGDWAGGSGADSYHNNATGNRDNPFKVDLFHTVFERVADSPEVSNKIMMGHFDTMMGIYTGKDASLTGGEAGTYNWLGSGDPKKPGGALSDILKQSTINMPPEDQALADSVVSRMGDYLQKHPKDKFVTDALPGLADVITHERYLPGSIYSQATPFAPGLQGYDAITGGVRDPKFGLLMPREVWDQLQQEAMRRPEGVYQVAGATEKWMQDFKSTQFGPNGPGNDATVNSLDWFEYENVRGALARNVDAVKGDIEADLAKRLEGNEKSREMAKALTGKVFEFVTNPSPTMVADAVKGTAGAAISGLVDWGIDSYHNAEAKDITKSYDNQLGALTKMGKSELLSPTPWGDYEQHGSALANQIGAGQYMPDPVTTQANPGGPSTEFTGDPRKYVGHNSETVWGSSGPSGVMTDDFLKYGGADGKQIVGTVPVSEMNHLQRAAYYEWMHDPAVQKWLDAQQGAQETGRDRAGAEQGGN